MKNTFFVTGTDDLTNLFREELKIDLSFVIEEEDVLFNCKLIEQRWQVFFLLFPQFNSLKVDESIQIDKETLCRMMSLIKEDCEYKKVKTVFTEGVFHLVFS